VHDDLRRWPSSDRELIDLQLRLGKEATALLATAPWTVPYQPAVGGCFVAFARGQSGPGRLGDRAWAAAVVWRPRLAEERSRRADRHLRGVSTRHQPRRADDILGQAVLADRVPAAYVPGLLARREGPVLAAAIAALERRPNVLLVDGTGLDHPRGAGLAVHLGAVSELPTVGVTRRPLLASGAPPDLRRGAVAPIHLDDRCVGFWVCTKSGARPVVAHAGWRTSPETAVQVALAASTEAARTPVPLQEARRVAREARALETGL
jgi:deoxyribonuclease V